MNVYIVNCLLYGDSAVSVCIAKDKRTAIQNFLKENEDKDLFSYSDPVEVEAIQIDTNKEGVRNFFGGWK